MWVLPPCVLRIHVATCQKCLLVSTCAIDYRSIRGSSFVSDSPSQRSATFFETLDGSTACSPLFYIYALYTLTTKFNWLGYANVVGKKEQGRDDGV